MSKGICKSPKCSHQTCLPSKISTPLSRNRQVLPTEILQHIVSNFTLPPLLDTTTPVFSPISKQTLQSLRLTSYLFNYLATPLLFHTLVLRVDAASAKTLLALSSDHHDPSVADLPRVSRYIRCLCFNLDCYLKDVASDRNAFHTFHELALDRMLLSNAQAHGLRITSYRQIHEDVDASSDESIKSRFSKTLSSWNALLSLWDPHCPPLFPSRGQSALTRNALSGAVDHGFNQYRKRYQEQKRLLKNGSRSIFLKYLATAVKNMPLLKHAILCDSRLLDNTPFNDPHRILTDAEALSQFLSRPHSWDKCAYSSANYTISTGSLLIELPIAFSRANTQLYTLELRTFLTHNLSLFQRKTPVWKSLETACQSLKSFSVDVAQEPQVAGVQYHIVHMNNIASHLRLTENFHLDLGPASGNPFITQYFASILSGESLRAWRLNSDAVCAMTNTNEPAAVDLSTAKAALARLATLNLINISIDNSNMEEFVGLLGPSLRKLSMTRIHFASGTFSNTLRLLRDYIAGRGGECTVHMRDWVAGSPQRPEDGHLQLLTDRAERYVNGEDEVNLASLVEMVP